VGLLRESWPLFVNQLLAGLFFKVDALLLPALASLRAAGAYGAAYTVVDGVGVISSSFTLALFPRLARQAEANGDGLTRAYRLGLRLLLQVAFPLAAGVSLLAEPLVGLIGGRSYLPEGALALSATIWFLPFSFTNGLTQYVLIALGQQRFLTVAFVVGLAFNLTANALLIPRYGILAAALVTVASELVLLIPFQWRLTRSIKGVNPLREGFHAVLATALMAPVVWWLRDGIHPLVAILAGILIYPLALWAVGGLDAEQRELLWRLAPARFTRRTASPSPIDY
jgi:O-antigen/teichoic acid export membrane protein